MATMTGGAGNDNLAGTGVDDLIVGLGGDDTLIGDGAAGGVGRDTLLGGEGNDTISLVNAHGTADGGAGDDLFVAGFGRSWSISGGDGTDTISLPGQGAVLFSRGNSIAIFQPVASPRPTGSFELRLDGVELLRTDAWTRPIPTDPTDFFSVVWNRTYNATALTMGEAYSGPVAGIAWQYLDDGGYRGTIGGTPRNDFINGLGGDDAIDGGAGNDVIDGGLGSNFLRGGAGIDTFFLDGRGGDVTWSTIVDWDAAEQLSLWGYRPGISRLTWLEQGGAVGYEGATLHADLDADGRIDASVTFVGVARTALATPREYDGLLWFS